MRARSVFCRLLLVAMGQLMASTPALAQSTATLEGTVTDAQGAVMPGVSLTIQNDATGVERTAATDQSGNSLPRPSLPALTASSRTSTDFRTRREARGVAQTVAVNFRMTVGAIAENLTVVGVSPLIETTTVSVGQVMAERTVQEIPLNGRHFVDLGPLMPGGVTPPQNAGLSAPLRGQGSFSFFSAGNRETAVNFMINGINLNDLANSQVTFQPSINTVSEFKVDNSTFSADTAVTPAPSSTWPRDRAPTGCTARRSISTGTIRSTRGMLQPRAEPEVAVQPQAVRRQSRRTDPEEQDLLLLQLRRSSSYPGC